MNTSATGKVNINLKDSTPVICEECGNMSFTEAYHLRKVSGILIGSTTPQIIPITVFSCTKCGHVNTEFLPKELRPLDSGTE